MKKINLEEGFLKIIGNKLFKIDRDGSVSLQGEIFGFVKNYP
jgi:hypothetical protein